MSSSRCRSIDLRAWFYIPFDWGKLALFTWVVYHYIPPVFIRFDRVLFPFHNRSTFDLPESRNEDPVLFVSWCLNHKCDLSLIYWGQLRHAYLDRLIEFALNELSYLSWIKIKGVGSQYSPFKISSIEKISIICNLLDSIRNFKVIATRVYIALSFLITFSVHIVFHYLEALTLVYYLQFG
jgi:hypothetical protein